MRWIVFPVEFPSFFYENSIKQIEKRQSQSKRDYHIQIWPRVSPRRRDFRVKKKMNALKKHFRIDLVLPVKAVIKKGTVCIVKSPSRMKVVMKIWNIRIKITVSIITVLNWRMFFSTSSTEKIFFIKKLLEKERERSNFLNNYAIWSSHGYWISSTTARAYNLQEQKYKNNRGKWFKRVVETKISRQMK